MSQKTHVLVFPCGAENAGEIYEALRYSLHVTLFGASSVEDYGRFRFPNYVGGLPSIAEAGFDAAFSALLQHLKIDVVFATHDSVMAYLADKAEGMGVFLVNGHPATAALARSKRQTYARFAGQPWIPAVFDDAAAISTWPVLVKPDGGQGGQGVTLAHTPAQLQQALTTVTAPVVVEYLPGKELTVDCFTDRHRALVWVGARTRQRVRAGITMRSQPLATSPAIQQIAEQLNAGMILRGPWFFQVKQADDGQWKLLEVACRVAGAMVVQRACGVNLPLMAIHDYLGRDVRPLPNPYITVVERCIASRAALAFDYDTVFIDFDDTLVIDGHANPTAMAFLYQALAQSKALVLITRHADDLSQTLARVRIAETLFDRILHLTAGEHKSDFVTPRSIFIDNHFPERADVAGRCGVPVFDVDALAFLIH